MALNLNYSGCCVNASCFTYGCYCDQACYFFKDCCSDIADIGCHPVKPPSPIPTPTDTSSKTKLCYIH